MANIINGDNGVVSGTAGLKSSSDGTGILAFQTNGTTAVTVDASQNVGIGTTSPSTYTTGTVLAVNSSGAETIPLALVNSNGAANTQVSLAFTPNTNIPLAKISAIRTSAGGLTAMTFGTFSGSAVTEAMRIDSSGTVMVNSTTQVDFSKFQVVGATASNNLVVLQDTGTTYGTSQFYQKFLNSSAAVAGSIQHTAVTTVAYSTTSDGRLKEDKGIATDMSVIDNTVIHDFVWKLDGLVDRGIFAQEAHLVKPTAISVGNDELTEDGNLRNPWGVDYSKYVPELIVYCQQLKKITQEQQALITTLTARITALEAK